MWEGAFCDVMVPCHEAVITEWMRLVILTYCYRPQTKFGASSYFQKRVSRILFGGEYLGRYPLGISPTPRDQLPPQTRYTLWDQVHPPEQCMLGDTGNKRVVRILLECILVHISFVTWWLFIIKWLSWGRRFHLTDVLFRSTLFFFMMLMWW